MVILDDYHPWTKVFGLGYEIVIQVKYLYFILQTLIFPLDIRVTFPVDSLETYFYYFICDQLSLDHTYVGQRVSVMYLSKLTKQKHRNHKYKVFVYLQGKMVSAWRPATYALLPSANCRQQKNCLLEHFWEALTSDSPQEQDQICDEKNDFARRPNFKT
jgi:hypothetical protein